MSDTTDLGASKRREVYDKFGGQEVFGQWDNFQRVTTGGVLTPETQAPSGQEDSMFAQASAEAEDVKKKSSLYQFGEYTSQPTGQDSVPLEAFGEAPDPVAFWNEQSKLPTPAAILRDRIKEEARTQAEQYTLDPAASMYKGTLAQLDMGVERSFEMVDGVLLPVLTDKEKELYFPPSSGFFGLFSETEKYARDRAISTAANAGVNSFGKTLREGIAGLDIAGTVQTTNMLGTLGGIQGVSMPGQISLRNSLTEGLVNFQKGLLYKNFSLGYGMDTERYMELERISRAVAPETTDKNGELTAWGEFSVASTMTNPGQVSFHMIKAFAKDPIGITTQLIVPSLATFLPTMAATAAEDPLSAFGPKAIAGGVASAVMASGAENALKVANIVNKAGRSTTTAYLSGVSSYTISMAAELNSQAQEAGYDLSKEEDVKAMLQDQELKAQWYETARNYAVPVAVIDAFSGALAGNIFTKGGRLSLVKETGVQSALGGVSEVAGILGKEGEIKASDIPDIFAEMFGEVGPGVVEVAMNNNMSTGSVHHERRMTADMEIRAILAGITEESTEQQKAQAKEAIAELTDLRNKEFLKDAEFLSKLSDGQRESLNKINNRIDFLNETVAELEAQKENATAEQAAELDKQIEINKGVVESKKAERAKIISGTLQKEAVEEAVGTVGITGTLTTEDVADYTTVENKNLNTTKPEDLIDQNLSWVQKIIPRVKAARVLRDLNSLANLTGANVSFAPSSEAFEKTFGTEVNAVWNPKTNTIYVNLEKSKGNFYFHEMSHPIVRKLKLENPDAFNALYANIANIKQKLGSTARTYGKWANEEYSGADAGVRQEEAIVEFFADVFDGKFDGTTTQVIRPVVEFIADFLTAIGATDIANDLMNQFEGRRKGQMTLSEFMKQLSTSGQLESTVLKNIRTTLSTRDVTQTVKSEVPSSEQTGQAAEQAPEQTPSEEAPTAGRDVQAPKEKVAPAKKRAPRSKKLDTEEAAPAPAEKTKKGRPAKKKTKERETVAQEKRLPKEQWAQKTYDEAHDKGDKKTMFNMKRYAHNQGFELKLQKGDTAYDPTTDKRNNKKAKATASKAKTTASKVGKKPAEKEVAAEPFVDKTGEATAKAQQEALAKMNELHAELAELQEKYRKQTSRKYHKAAAKTLNEIDAIKEKIEAIVPETKEAVSTYESSQLTKSQLPTEKESKKRGREAKKAIEEQKTQGEIDQKVEEEVGPMSIKDYMGLETLDGGVVQEQRVVYNEDGSIYAIFDFGTLTIKRPAGKGNKYKSQKLSSLRAMTKKYVGALKEKVPMANTAEAERLSIADATLNQLKRNINGFYNEGKDDIARMLEETSLPRAEEEYQAALEAYRAKKESLASSGQKTVRGVEANLVARRRPTLVLLNRAGKPVVFINANTLEIGRRKTDRRGRRAVNYEYQQYNSASAFSRAVNQIQKDVEAGTLKIQLSQEIDYQRKAAASKGIISDKEYNQLVREADALTERTKARDARREATEKVNAKIRKATANVRENLPPVPEEIQEALSNKLMSTPLSTLNAKTRAALVDFIVQDLDNLANTERGKTSIKELHSALLDRFNVLVSEYERIQQAREFAKQNKGIFDQKLPSADRKAEETPLRKTMFDKEDMSKEAWDSVDLFLDKIKVSLMDMTLDQAMNSSAAMAKFLGNLGYSQEESSRVKRVSIDTTLRESINGLASGTVQEQLSAIAEILKTSEVMTADGIYSAMSTVLNRALPLPMTPNMVSIHETMRNNKKEQLAAAKDLMFSRKSNSKNNELAQAMQRVLNVTGNPVSVTNLHAVAGTSRLRKRLAYLADYYSHNYAMEYMQNVAPELIDTEEKLNTVHKQIDDLSVDFYESAIDMVANAVVAGIDAIIQSDRNSSEAVDVYEKDILEKYFTSVDQQGRLYLNKETAKRLRTLLSEWKSDVSQNQETNRAEGFTVDMIDIISKNLEQFNLVHSSSMVEETYTPAPGVERVYEMQRRYFARPAGNKYTSIKDKRTISKLIQQKLMAFETGYEFAASVGLLDAKPMKYILDLYNAFGPKKWKDIVGEANPIGKPVNDMRQLAEAFGHIRTKIRETSAIAVIYNDKIQDVIYLTSLRQGDSVGFNSTLLDILNNKHPNATSIALIHNHPSGIPIASQEDLKMSAKAESVLGKKYGGTIILNAKKYGFIAPIGSSQATIASSFLENSDRNIKSLIDIYHDKIPAGFIEDGIEGAAATQDEYLDKLYSKKTGVQSYSPIPSRKNLEVKTLPSGKNMWTSAVTEIIRRRDESGASYAISVPSSDGQVVVDFGRIDVERESQAGIVAKLQMAKRQYGPSASVHVVLDIPKAGFMGQQAVTNTQDLLNFISREMGAGVVNSYSLVGIDNRVLDYDLSKPSQFATSLVTPEDYELPAYGEASANNYGSPIITQETFTVDYGGNLYSLPELIDRVVLPSLKEELESYLADVEDTNILDAIEDLVMFPIESDIMESISHLTAGLDLSSPDGGKQLVEAYLNEVFRQMSVAVPGLPQAQKLVDSVLNNIIEEVATESNTTYDASELMFSRKSTAYSKTTAAQKTRQNRRNVDEIQRANRDRRKRVRETALDKRYEVFRFINHHLNEDNSQKAKILEAFVRTGAGMGKSVDLKIKEYAKDIFGKNPSLMTNYAQELLGDMIVYRTILEHNRRRLDKLQSQYATRQQALGDYGSVDDMQSELDVAREQVKEAQKRENALMAELTAEGLSTERLEEIQNELSVAQELIDEATVLVEELPYRIAVVNGTAASIKTLQNPLINPENLTVEEINEALETLEQDSPEEFYEFNETVDRFFDVAKQIAMEKYNAGLISESQMEALVRYGYSPRIFVQRLIDADMLNVSMRGQTSRSGVASLAAGSSSAMITNPVSLLKTMVISHENAIERNNVAVRLFDFVKETPGNGLIEIIEPKIVKGKRTFPPMTEKAGFTVIEVLIDGEKHRMSVPTTFYNSWKGLQSFNMPVAVKLISGSYFTKLGATIMNPAFSFVNLMADFMMVTTFTNSFGKHLPVAMARGVSYIIPALMKSMAANNPFYQMNVSSIREAYDHGIGMDNIRLEAIDLGKNLNNPDAKTQSGRTLKVVGDWLYNASTFLQENFEMATRLAIYNYQKEVIAKNNPNLSEEEIGRLAALKAREHLDYSVGGTHASVAESFVPYTNAALRALETSIYAMSPKAGNTIFGNRVKLKEDGQLDNRVVDTAITANIAMYAIGYAAIMMFNNAIGKRDDDEDDHDLKHINDEVKNRNIVLLTGKRNAQGEPHYIKIRIPYEMTPFIRMSQMMFDGTQFTDHHRNNGADAVRLAYENIPLIGQGFASYSKGAEKVLMNLFGQVPTVSSLIAYYGNYDTFYDQSVWHSQNTDVNPGVEIDYNTRPTFIKWAMGYGMSPKRTQVAFEKIFTGTRSNFWANIAFNKLDVTNREELINSGVIIKEQIKSPDEISKNAIVGRITENYGNIDWQMADVYESMDRAKEYKTQKLAENNQIRALVKSQAKNNQLGTAEGFERLYEVVYQIAPRDVERQNELIENYAAYALPKVGLPRRSMVYAGITDVTKRADALLTLKINDPEMFTEVIYDLLTYQQITGKSLITETMVERFKEFEEGD